jgi:hypothetical protein
MNLYGREWSRRELEARLGRLEQVGGLRRATYVEGPAYTVLPSRGLDIGLAEFGGVPLCWLSPNGETHPAFFDAHGTNWLRTAAGGLLMTCGFSQVGSPGTDSGEDLGLHGHAHHTPARQVVAEGAWEGDEYLTSVRGVVEENSIFGWNLRLRRQINSRLGCNEILLHDVVENAGFEPAPHMQLYHFNFGYPLLDEHTKLHLPSAIVRSREPGQPLADLENWQSPQPGVSERVYYHEEVGADSDGWAFVSIHQPDFPARGRPLTLKLAWKVSTLPVLVQWKMPGEGMHVLGLEPANCHVEGRAAERERGSLVMLEPGDSREYHLMISLVEE